MPAISEKFENYANRKDNEDEKVDNRIDNRGSLCCILRIGS